MADVVVIENPILNSPCEEPKRHFKFTERGHHRGGGRGTPEELLLRPCPGLQETWRAGGHRHRMDQGPDRGEHSINRVRFEVNRWRIGGRAGVSRTTSRLLGYWNDPARENKLFFCQIEAVETAIYITEVAKKAGDTWIENNLKSFNEDVKAGPVPHRLEDGNRQEPPHRRRCRQGHRGGARPARY